MKCVKERSKRVLDILWDLAIKNKGYRKLDNDKDFLPLTIEIILENAISICHYKELNGDLMRNPEMCFWKDDNGDYFPYYFRNDYVAYEDIAGEIEGSKLIVFNEKQQLGQIEFAKVWLDNINYQQFKV